MWDEVCWLDHAKEHDHLLRSHGQRPRPTFQLLSGPGQVWLLKSPEGKGQKEKHDSSSYNREHDITEGENGWNLLDVSLCHHLGMFAWESIR